MTGGLAACSPPLGIGHSALEACAPSKQRPPFSFLQHLEQAPPMCFFHGCRIAQNGYGGRKACFREERLFTLLEISDETRNYYDIENCAFQVCRFGMR